MSAFAALMLVVPLAALHPYKNAIAAPTTPAPTSMTMVITPTKPATKGSDFPESFKVQILPAPTIDTAALARTALTKPLAALSVGAAKLGEGLQRMQAKGSEIVTISGKTPTCDNFRFNGDGSSTSTHIHADDDNDGSAIIEFTRFNGDRCSSATITGRIKYTMNEDDILEMSPGSHATFRQRTSTEDRELSVTPARDGGLQRVYRYNGSNADYDGAARRWFAAYLPTVLMEAGINVGPRVAQWRGQGGVNNVLAHIATMSSSGAKRSHYDALLDGDKLTAEEFDRVMKSAGENISSSGDLRAILTRAAPAAKVSRQNPVAFERAVSSIASSGDKAAVLHIYGQTDDRDMLLSVMRAADGISSSGDRARLLQALAPRYLTRGDPVLVSAWFARAKAIPSSGDLHNALMVAMPFAAASTDVAASIIRTARVVPSSGDRSRILIAIVNTGALTTKELRDAFFNAVEEIPAEGDRGRVLSAAVSVLRQER